MSLLNQYDQTSRPGQTFGQARHIENAHSRNRSCTRIYNDYRFPSKKYREWRLWRYSVQNNTGIRSIVRRVLHSFDQICERKISIFIETSKIFLVKSCVLNAVERESCIRNDSYNKNNGLLLHAF